MRKLFSILLLTTMLFNQIALAETNEETQKEIDLNIEFQINEKHLLNKILNTIPSSEYTMFEKLLNLNENQIKGYYSLKNKAVKINSNIETNNEIIEFLENKNLDFTEKCENKDSQESQCIYTSNKKVEKVYISLDNNGFYLHENDLPEEIKSYEFTLMDNQVARLKINSEDNPSKIELIDEGNKFGLLSEIELSDEELVAYLKKRAAKLNFLDYITPSTIVFFETKGMTTKYDEKYKKIIKNNLDNICYAIDKDCTEGEQLLKFTGNIYNLPEDSVLYNLIKEKDSAAILDINDNLEISYTYLFKDSKDEINNINQELKERLKVLGFIRYGDLGLDTYEIQGSISEVNKALAGETIRREVRIERLKSESSENNQIDENQEINQKSLEEQFEEAQFNIKLFNTDSQNKTTQKSYLNIIELEDSSDV